MQIRLMNVSITLCLLICLLFFYQPKKTPTQKTDSVAYTILKTDTVFSKNGRYVVTQKINQFNPPDMPLDSLEIYFNEKKKKQEQKGYLSGKLKETKEWYTDSVLHLKEHVCYWDNGQKKRVASWYSNKQMQSLLSFNIQGKETGWGQWWFKNGQLEQLTYFDDLGNTISGQSFNEDGKLASYVKYDPQTKLLKFVFGSPKDSIYFTEYYKGKCLQHSKAYANGKVVKIITTEKKLRLVKKYKNGEIVKTEYYDCCDCLGMKNWNFYSKYSYEDYLIRIDYFRHKQLYKRELYKNRKAIKTINY